MCAAALAQVGIGRVVFGCRNDKFGGCGSILNLHQEDKADLHGYSVTSGVLESEAVTLFRSFYDRENFNAPEDKRKRKDPVDGVGDSQSKTSEPKENSEVAVTSPQLDDCTTTDDVQNKADASPVAAAPAEETDDEDDFEDCVAY